MISTMDALRAKLRLAEERRDQAQYALRDAEARDAEYSELDDARDAFYEAAYEARAALDAYEQAGADVAPEALDFMRRCDALMDDLLSALDAARAARDAARHAYHQTVIIEHLPERRGLHDDDNNTSNALRLARHALAVFQERPAPSASEMVHAAEAAVAAKSRLVERDSPLGESLRGLPF